MDTWYGVEMYWKTKQEGSCNNKSGIIWADPNLFPARPVAHMEVCHIATSRTVSDDELQLCNIYSI